MSTRLWVIAGAVTTLIGPTLPASDAESKLIPLARVVLPGVRAHATADVHVVRVRTADATHAGALFATHSWYVAPPPPPPPPPATAVSLAPVAPIAPPLPFQYMGSYQAEGAAQVFFLTHGDRVYDAKIGDILENTYSVDGFNGSQLLLTYKPLNIQQQLSVGGSQ